ncbi:MAG TPA: hypothetical protein VGY66_30870 [Gemmataceae bacterium]|jgi:hypothetical protein|nr:hypothetical protein [Gemmataceae bacterium]
MNRLYALLLLAALPLFFLTGLGCGADASAKPKIMKGGLDPEKGQKQQQFKVEFSK